MENIALEVLAKLMVMPKFQALIVKEFTLTIANSTKIDVNAHITANATFNTNGNSSTNIGNNASNLEPCIVEKLK